MAKSIWKKRKKMQPNRFEDVKPNPKAEPIPKSRTLVADRTPAKEPNLWKKVREGPYQPGDPAN